MRQLWSITHNTFMQTVRQPIYGILILIAFGVLLVSFPLSAWTMGEATSDYQQSDQKMFVNLGLATMMISGLLIAAFSASAALSREIEDKTALTVISKPVSRYMFVLGKFFGVAVASALAYYLVSLVFIMLIRHQVMSTGSDKYDIPVIVIGMSGFLLAIAAAFAGNYFFNWSFTTAGVYCGGVLMTVAMALIAFIGKEWEIVPFGSDINPQLFVAMGLIFMVVIMLVALAVAASTRLGQLGTLMICFVFLSVGMIHGSIFDSWSKAAPIAGVAGWLAPNLTFFFQLDALMKDQAIPADFIWLAVAYGSIYSAALLAIGIGLFQNRQLESTSGSGSIPSGVALLAWAGRIGALIGGIIAVIMLSMEENHTTGGLIYGGSVLAGAIITWLFMLYFGRGAAWSYWIALVLAVAAAGVFAGKMLVPALEAWPVVVNPIGLVAALLIAIGITVVMILPKTRRHFHST